MLHSRIFTFNPLGTNCTVLWAGSSKTCTVVDPGMSCAEEYTALSGFLTEEGLTPDAIFLTHGHFDHVWGVDHLLKTLDVPVYLNPADEGLARNGASALRGMENFKVLRHDFPITPVGDGDVLSSGGVSWTAIHTPGHTPGGMCYYSADDNLILSGDTLFAGSIGRTDLTGGDYDVLMASIRERLLVLPDDTDLIPGHGQPTTIGREALYNPFLQPFNDADGDFV